VAIVKPIAGHRDALIRLCSITEDDVSADERDETGSKSCCGASVPRSCGLMVSLSENHDTDPVAAHVLIHTPRSGKRVLRLFQLPTPQVRQDRKMKLTFAGGTTPRVRMARRRPGQPRHVYRAQRERRCDAAPPGV
jgi:hypothetical protein